jgi:hypothetical protein
MKKTILFILIAAGTFLYKITEAQSVLTSMEVYDRAGTIDNYSLFNIRKVTFDSAATMTVHETNAVKTYYAIDTIRKIIFNNLTTASPEAGSNQPGSLIKVYPNPVCDKLTIEYCLVKPERIAYKIFNIYGELIVNENIGNKPAGNYKYVWNRTNSSGHPVADGTYLCHLIINDTIYTEKIIIIN